MEIVSEKLRQLFNEMLAGDHDGNWDNLPSYTPKGWGEWTSSVVWSADRDHAIVGRDADELDIVPIGEVFTTMDFQPRQYTPTAEENRICVEMRREQAAAAVENQAIHRANMEAL